MLITLFVIQIMTFIFSVLLISLLNEHFFSINTSLFFSLNVVPIALWFLYVGFALFSNQKNKINKIEYRKYQLSVLIVFLSILISTLLIDMKLPSFSLASVIVNLTVGLLDLIALIIILRFWVKNFVKLYDNRKETFSDYINYIILLAFPPLGIYVSQKLIYTISLRK
ncbi:MAG: hypothetical protein ACYC25_03680 [Paludibacter sp.]